MSNAAQDEADRLFNQVEHHASHPEDQFDRDSLSQHSSEPKEDYRSDENNEDEDALHDQNTSMATTANYHVPSTRFNANTGPKGVIADAQSFTRAKQSTLRTTLNSFANALTSSKPTAQHTAQAAAASSPGGSPRSEQDSDNDEEFMRQWRQNRLQELHLQSTAATNTSRRHSPSQRTWGRLDAVDATGYLDAIEKVKDDVTVVVCIYDPESAQSAEVEDVLGTLAYKYSTTRFVKLHHEVAEMTEIQVPALLAYRGGDVFASVSDVKGEGLEDMLVKVEVLK